MSRQCPLCGGDGRVPEGIETWMWTEHRWRYMRSGLLQTALVADVNLDEYERVQRRGGRWYESWELM